MRHVGYADYVPGLFYVSPGDVLFDGDMHVEVSRAVRRKAEEPRLDFDR